MGKKKQPDRVTALLGIEYEDNATATTAESTAFGKDLGALTDNDEGEEWDQENRPREPPDKIMFGGLGTSEARRSRKRARWDVGEGGCDRRRRQGNMALDRLLLAHVMVRISIIQAIAGHKILHFGSKVL